MIKRKLGFRLYILFLFCFGMLLVGCANSSSDEKTMDDDNVTPTSTPTGTKSKTVFIKETGLTWQRDGSSKCKDDKTRCTHDEATKYCGNLQLGGKDDWRLPTAHELFGIVDFSRSKPAIDPKFSNTQFSTVRILENYWASDGNGTVMLVDFIDGTVLTAAPGEQHYVRCVSGVSAKAEFERSTNDNTVTDKLRGLVWQDNNRSKISFGSTLDISRAKSQCEDLGLGNKEDWRLPTAHELESLLDRSRETCNNNNDNSKCLTKEFEHFLVTAYWSSTPVITTTWDFIVVDFGTSLTGTGTTSGINKEGEPHDGTRECVICVREQ